MFFSKVKANLKPTYNQNIDYLIVGLENPNFIRLRCGISRTFGPGVLFDYVLSDFKENELPFVNEMRDKAEHAINYLIEQGFARASSDINSGKI